MDHRIGHIPKDKEENFTERKGSVYQEDIIIPNMYGPNNRIAKYMSKISWELDKSIVITRDSHTSLSVLVKELTRESERIYNLKNIISQYAYS